MQTMIFGMVWLSSGFSQASVPLESFRQTLIQQANLTDFPVLRHDPTLSVNARYTLDTIWIGQVQPDFQTHGDTLSLIFHEYTHHVLREQFPVALSDEGTPVQWMTGESYSYTPCEAEIERALAHLTFSPDSLLRLQLRRDLAKPRILPFRYAPSSLAREEIVAYQAQLEGGQKGYYALSSEAQRAIEIRLYQLRGTLERRLEYEARKGLGPDGLGWEPETDRK